MPVTAINANHLSTVLHYLFRHPLTSRADIASNTTLTKSLVSHVISFLQEQGYVKETGEEVRTKKGSGKARKLIMLDPGAAAAIGVEFTAEQVCAVLCRLDGTTEASIVRPLSDVRLDALNQEILDLIRELRSAGSLPVLGIGLGVPGHYDPDSDRIVTNNPAWKHFSLREIREGLDPALPVYVENNVECMSYGRYLFQSEHSPEEFILLHIGPGLYCSFFDSALTGRKKSDYFGEIGHSVVDIHGTLCECGKHGCLQTYISSKWLLERAGIYLRNGSAPILAEIAAFERALTMEDLQEAYRRHDPRIRSLLEDGLDRLAVTLSNLLIVHDADRIFLNSSLLQSEELEAYFRRKVKEQFSFILGFESVPVEILPFRKDRGAQGACALVFYQELIAHPRLLDADDKQQG